MVITASSTRRGVHELTADLLVWFFSTERDWRVPSHRANPGHGTRRRAQGQGEGQGEGEDGPAGGRTGEQGPGSRGPGRGAAIHDLVQPGLRFRAAARGRRGRRLAEQ